MSGTDSKDPYEGRGTPSSKVCKVCGGTTHCDPAQHVDTCGARLRSHGPGTNRLCARKKGEGTDHPGSGRCYLHGGNTPIKTGLKSKVDRPSIKAIRTRIEQEIADGADPFDLVPEATTVRSLSAYFEDNFEDIMAALIAWNTMEDVEAKVEERRARLQHIPSYHDLSKLVETTSRIVERAHKVTANRMYSPETFASTYSSMAVVLAQVCERHDRMDIAEEVKKLWGRIQVQGVK